MRKTPEEQRQAWAAYVKRLRAAASMSVRTFADRLGVDEATVWRYETARTKPHGPEVPERIAELFQLDLDEVLAAAGLRRDIPAPAEPTRAPDPEIDEIQRSGLPERIRRELVEHVMQQRARDEERRIEDLRRMIRLAGGRRVG